MARVTQHGRLTRCGGSVSLPLREFSISDMKKPNTSAQTRGQSPP
jgi:hypothetical protein